MEIIGGRITDLRKKNQISQEQLAVALQVSKQTIYNWENGKSEPSLKNIDVLCRYFSVKPDYFFGGEEQATPALTATEQAAETATSEAAATEQVTETDTAATDTVAQTASPAENASVRPFTQEEFEALTEKISDEVADKIKRSNRGKLLLLATCLSIIAFVILAALTVIFGFSVFSTNRGGIDYFIINGVSDAEYGIIVSLAVVALVLSILFVVLYIKNKKHK